MLYPSDRALSTVKYGTLNRMKTILCYGDSNTWGYCPKTQGRLSADDRWPGVLRRELGAAYGVIEEGLGGRTTVWNDPVEGEHKNGKTYLRPCLETHQPVDVVIIMLGTNDLKRRFGVGAFDIARGAAVLSQIVRSSAAGPDGTAPRVLLVTPPPVAPLAGTHFAEMFAGAEEKSRQLAREFRRVADELGCELLDAGDVVVSSPRDGIHLHNKTLVSVAFAAP
jgi:lysophospholipase L1-like esterase